MDARVTPGHDGGRKIMPRNASLPGARPGNPVTANRVKSVVDAVSREIGSEFFSGSPEPSAEVSQAMDEASAAGEPLETMARVMFDKANVQQRLASLERAVDSLGAGLKPEIAELREEIVYVRLMLEEISLELRELSGKNKKSA